MSLRGGGCGSSSAAVVTPMVSKPTELKIPSGLVNQIQYHSQRIAENVVTVMDQQSNLMNSFQFFQIHSRSLWSLVINNQYTNQSVELIEKSVEQLMSAFKSLIKANAVYTYYIASIVSQLSWILFAFYTTNGKRQLEVKKQKSLLNEIELIEEQLEIEKNLEKYINNIEYELYVIKSIIFICPTNSKEGVEILQQFLGGALQAAATFTPNLDLVQGIARGIMYIYQESQRASRKKKLEIIFTLLQYKFLIMELLERGTDAKTIADQLSSVYSKIIKQSTDWVIWNAWTSVLSQLFQFKPILQNLKLQKSLLEDIEGKDCLIPILEEQSILSLKYQNLQKDKTLKRVFDSCQALQEQAKLQIMLLQGYGMMHSYEQQYFARWEPLKESTKNATGSLPISLTSISSLLNITEAITTHQEQFTTLIKQLDFQDFQKLKQAEKLLSDSIKKTLLLYSEIGRLSSFSSQIHNFIQQQNLTTEYIFEESDSIQLAFCQVYLNCLKMNNGSKIMEAFQKEIYENILTQLSQRFNQQEFIKLVSQFKNNQNDPKVIQLVSESLKSLNLQNEKSLKQKDTDCLIGLDQAIHFVQQSRDLLKWNIQAEVLLKIGLKTLLVSRKPDIAKEIISQLISQTQQLISYEVVSKSIKLMYGQFLACKNKNVFSTLQVNDTNKFEKMIYNLFIEKLRSSNLVNQILLNNFFKDSIKNIDVRFDQEICKLLQEQLEATINYLSQMNSGLKMINDCLAYEIESHQETKDDLEILQDQNIFYELHQMLQQQLNPYQIATCCEKFNQYFKAFNSALLNNQEQLQKNDSDFYTLLTNRNEKNRLLLEFLEILSSIKIVQEKDEQIANKLKNDIIQLLDDLMKQEIKSSIEKENKKDKYTEEIQFYSEIMNEVEQIQLRQQQALQMLQEIGRDSEKLSQSIENFRSIEKLGTRLSDYKSQQDESKQFIIEAIKKLTEKTPNLIIDFSQIQRILKDKRSLGYKKQLESQLYFILNQIENKDEDNVQSYFYDKIKEEIEDQLSKHIWRIRQAFIFELLQMKNSCLNENAVSYSSGLLIKLTTYETEKRIRVLFEDQQGSEISLLMNKYWPSAEQQIQQKIKDKLKELNEIAQQLTVESMPQLKIKLRKEYARLEKEIQLILDNIQKIGNQLGITILFFQDLKQDLIRIETQIQQLSEAMETINKDVKYLKGRSVKELLEIRMKRVLQHRLVVNSESVYITIKTIEKFEEEGGAEDIETILFTEDLFGCGEINEFIWKEQKESLLIHGQAGSGKSTAARKIEEFLWLVYEKNRNQQDYIPLIPVFVSLPQLKDPVYCAVEETLRSDNYRFSERQIEEFKEAIENRQFKLIIIMDSYDELKQQYLGLNLNVSNKLSKWRCSTDKNKYPKIITTSRSELFTIQGYNSWFLSESNSLKFYKEVRLIQFNQEQIKQYIEEYTFLCVKKIIKEFYFAQKQNLDYEEFENVYNDIIKTVGLLKMKQQGQQMLSKDQIQQLINKCSNFLTTEHQKTMSLMLQEIWSSKYYYNLIQVMNLDSVIETPFMIEIVMDVLPYIVKQRQEINNLKEKFLKKFIYLSSKDLTIEKQALDEWQGIVNNTEFMNVYINEFSESKIYAAIHHYFKNNSKIKIIERALLLEPLSTYDFYVKFLEHYFKRQVHKLRESGEQIDFEQISTELWEFAHRLSNEMTFRNLSQVHFQASGLIFKKTEKDWMDDFFNDDCQEGQYKRLFRKCIPINQKGGIYSFNHKSLQEFLVAKWFIEQITKFQVQEIEDDIKNIKQDLLQYSFFQKSWDFDYMQGSIKFILDKIKFNDELKIKLRNCVFLTRKYKQFVIGGSNSLYLLNLMGYLFCDMDFGGIEISDISLTGANFFNCNFSDTKFSRVKLSGVNLNQSKIIHSKWQETQIDELPKIETTLNSINTLTYLKEDQIFLVSDESQIKQFNLYKLQEMNKFNLDFKPKLSILSNDNKLLGLINNSDILLFDLKGNKVIQKLTYGDCFSQYKLSATFAPDAKSIFLGGPDGLDQLKLNIEQEQVQQIKQKFTKGPAKKQMAKKAIGKAFQQREENESDEEDYQKHTEEQQTIRRQGDIIVSPDQFESISEDGVETLRCAKVILLQNSHSFSLYNPVTKQLQTTNTLFQRLQCVDINKDSTIIAAGSAAGQIQLFYISQLDQPIGLNGHKELISQLQFTGDGKFLISCSWDKSIRLWNTSQQTQVNKIVYELKPKVRSLCLITDTFLVLTGFDDGLIQLWDLDSSNQREDILQGHKEYVSCCIFSPDGNMAISGSLDTKIKMWDVITGKQIGSSLDKHTQKVTALAMSHDSQDLFSGGDDGFIYIWDVQSQKLKNELNPINHYGCTIESIQVIFDNDCYKLVTLTSEQIVHLWNVDFSEYCLLYDYKDESRRRIPAQESMNVIEMSKNLNVDVVRDINITYYFLKDQKITAIGASIDGSIKYIGTNKGYLLMVGQNSTSNKFEVYKGPIEFIKILENKKYFLTVGENKITVWKASNFSIKDTLQGHMSKINDIISFKDFIISCDYCIKIWNLSAKTKLMKTILLENNQKITALGFSETNQTLFAGTEYGRIYFIDFATYDEKNYLDNAHEGGICNITWISNLQMMLTASYDFQIKLWQDKKTMQTVTTQSPIQSLFLSLNQNYFILQTQVDIQVWALKEREIQFIESLINIKKTNQVMVLFNKQQVLWADDIQLESMPLMNKKMKNAYVQEARNHYPLALVTTDNEIITADYQGNLGFWNFNGDKVKEIYKGNEREFKYLGISPEETRVVMAFKNTIKVITLDKLEIIFSKEFGQVKLTTANFLSEESLLVTSEAQDQQVQIIKIGKNDVIILNEHIGTPIGVDVHPSTNSFLTYGWDKSIRYYQKVDQGYSCKFAFTKQLKFECQGALIQGSEITSKSKIELTELLKQKKATIK